MSETTPSPVSAGAPAPKDPVEPAPKDAAAPAGGLPDPKEELVRLKGLAQSNQESINKLSNENALASQNIASLQAGITEVENTVQAYTQSLAVVADRSNLQSFVEQKMSLALAAIGTAKPQLDALVTDVEANIQTQATLATKAQSDADAAQAAYTVAVNKASEKKAAYDAVKAKLPQAQAAVVDVKALKTLVSSAAEAGNYPVMYTILGEIQRVLSAMDIPSPADLGTQLNTTLSDLHAALSDARVKKIATDAAAANSAAAQKALNDANLGRRNALFEAAKKWKAPAASPAAQPQSPAPQPGGQVEAKS